MPINNIRILNSPITYQEILSIKGLKVTGIYKIENTVNHKVYIGKSKDVINRLKEHTRDEHNEHLKSSFEKYGLDKFSFEVIKQTYDLDYWEIFLIQIYHATDDRYGYNVAIGGEGGNLGDKWHQRLLDTLNTEEYHESLRQAQQKRWESEEERNKYRETTKNQWNDSEIRRKRINGLKGHKISEYCKQRTSEVNRLRYKNCHWYTNGVKDMLVKECPEGFYPGRTNAHSKGSTNRPMSEEMKRFYSEKFTGSVWWNNGKTQIQSKTQPEGFVRGKLPNQKKRHWYNNGKQNIMCEVCPEGYVPGKLLSEESKNHIQNKGYHFYNNGKVQTVAKECPVGFVPGGLPRKPFTEEYRQKLSESHKKNKT